jgi:hypothetical protein
MNENPETETRPAQLGGGYIKVGAIKPNRDGSSQHVKCQVSARNGGPRVVPAHGKFGEAVEIPVVMDGIPKILSLPSDSGDVRALRTLFGPDMSTWAGKTVDIWESDVLSVIRIQPVN